MKQYHIQLEKKQLCGAEYAILPGDPGRVPSLALAIDPEAQRLAENREYHSYLARFHGHPILVCSTGIGGPSTSIVVEELANLGIRYFLRVGTTGVIQDRFNLGDLMITKAAVRMDGASDHYAPMPYPAVASLRFTSDIMNAAEHLAVPYHVGIAVTSATFYPGQERYENFSHYVPRHLQGSLQEWQQLNATHYEMEAATLFTMANVFGLHAACFCGVVAHRVQGESIHPEALAVAQQRWQALTVETLRQSLMRRCLI